MSLPTVSCRVYSFAISTLLCTILLSVVSLPQAEAQVENQRVRVTHNSGVTYTGQVTERSDSLLVVLDGTSGQYHAFSYADVRDLAVSQGMRSYATTGFIGGALAGASLGLAVCLIGCDLQVGALIVTVGAITAGAVGGIAGRLIERERWTTIPIPIPGQAALRIEPLLGVGLAARPVIGVRLKL